MSSLTNRIEHRGEETSASPDVPSIGCYVNERSAKKHHISGTTQITYAGKKRGMRFFGLFSIVLAILGLGLLFGFQRHLNDEISFWDYVAGESQRLFAFAQFPVEQVHIVGHQQTSEKEVVNSLGDVWATSLLSVDTEMAQMRIERLPWVKGAVVERVFPHGLNIYIKERVAIGRWVTPNGTFVFDETGYVIERAKVGRHIDLAMYAGHEAPNAAKSLQIAIQKHPEIDQYVRKYTRVGRRRWTLHLNNGMAILLPEKGVEAAFLRIEELHSAHNILNRALKQIDLRLADRVTLLPKSSSKTKTIVAEGADILDESQQNQINKQGETMRPQARGDNDGT